MAQGQTKWDLAGWTKGKPVRFFDTLGLKGAIYPQFQPRLAPSAAAVSGPVQVDTGQGAPPQSQAPGGNAPTNAKHYTYKQLEQLWVQAGGNPKYAAIAAAIAEAESSGNAGATNNDSNGSTDRGLWQINSSHGSQSTYDPLANARAAVAISSNGSNWSPWTTYKTGAYRKYLQ